LVVGKVPGIFFCRAVGTSTRSRGAAAGVTWRSVFGVGWLGGIGFTMSLFVATLAFGYGPLLNSAKIGIVAGSVVAAFIGAMLLRLSPSAPSNGAG
jgi:Na+:H+ antiporter, NhaA family